MSTDNDTEHSPLELLGAIVVSAGLREKEGEHCAAYQELLAAAQEELLALPSMDIAQYDLWCQIGYPTFSAKPWK